MRVWLYNQLIGDTGPGGLKSIMQPRLLAGELLSNRVAAGEGLRDRLTTTPYLFYTMGNATDEQLSETSLVYTQFFQIYVHDKPADYQMIDALVVRLKKLLHGSRGQEGAYDILNVKHLETSRDLDDVTLGTIMRYVRFSAMVKEYTDG